MAPEQVKSPYTGVLTEAQKYAAYVSGKHDAAVRKNGTAVEGLNDITDPSPMDIGEEGLQQVEAEDQDDLKVADSRPIKPLIEKTGDSDIMEQKLIGGALDPGSERAEKHAEQYYKSVRKMTTDVKRIAENTGYTVEQIQRIKNFIFMDVHDLGDGRISTFDPIYEMAESWQRLIDGRDIQPHDLTLLRHEIMENELMDQGYTQDEAHRITSKKYNYTREAHEYHDKIRKHKPER